MMMTSLIYSHMNIQGYEEQRVKFLIHVKKEGAFYQTGVVSGQLSAPVMLSGFSIRSKLAENHDCAMQEFELVLSLVVRCRY